MKKSRILFVVILVACMAMSMVACKTETPAEAPAQAPAETPAATETPAAPESGGGIKMGFIIPFASHEWYANTQKGAQMTADELGYELIVTDCRNDQDTQISQGQAMLAQQVDVLIMAPVDGDGVMPLIDEARDQGIPVVTHAVVAQWQDIFVGTPDWDAGVALGVKAGEYALEKGLDTPNCLLVGLPALPSCVDRSEGFKEGMLSVIPEATFIDVDGGGNKDTAMPAASDALTGNPNVNTIMGINDDSTLGGVQAYDALGYDMGNLIAWGFGCEGIAAKNEMSNPDSPYKGSLAMFPEYYGRMTVLAARDILDGIEHTNEWLKLPVEVMTIDNLSGFYTQEGDSWNILWPNIEALGFDYRPLAEALH